MSEQTLIFGEVQGVKPGDRFVNRRSLHDAKVHRGLIKGIAAQGSAIVLNEGYVDDKDFGNEILYTGEGGRDQNTGRQIKDQKLVEGNLALVENCKNNVPIRVTRGPKLRSGYQPESGYRYDGLYMIDSFSEEIGIDGFKIFRYRMHSIQSVFEESPASVQERLPSRVLSVSNRVVRDPKIAKQVKELYEFTCQICDTRLETPLGPYAESCHIKPLGIPHNGPDILSNVLCLCPNCHLMFDKFGYWVESGLLVQPISRILAVHPEHGLEQSYFDYHRQIVGV